MKLRGEHYMESLDGIKTICTGLTEEEYRLFLTVQEHYCQRTMAGTLRMLVLREAKALKKMEENDEFTTTF